MLQLKPGDKVLVELEVFEDVGVHTFKYKTITGLQSVIMNKCWIKEVIPAPFDPKVGDKVWWVAQDKLGDYKNASCTSSGGTLLYIHHMDARKFAVVAFLGDIPKSVWFKNLRESWAECVA